MKSYTARCKSYFWLLEIFATRCIGIIGALALLVALSSEARHNNFAQYFERGCLEALPVTKKNLIEPFNEFCLPQLASKEKYVKLSIPKRVLDWGSNGRGGSAWQFKDQRCNDFFISLQQHIVADVPLIRETPHDLFHAHAISYGAQAQGLALVFHAKEYPKDKERIKNRYQEREEIFYSTDMSFKNRNFIYFSGDEGGIQSGLYSIAYEDICRELFAAEAVNTVSESLVANKINGYIIGDVNLFYPDKLVRIMYNDYPDEENDTGKSMLERTQINTALTWWIKSLLNRPLAYFLTGL